MKRRGEGVRRKRYQSLAARQNRHGFLFVFPWIIGFVLFFLIPLGQSIYYSFCQVTITEYGMMTDFVGLDNFYYAFRVASNYVDNLKESLINFDVYTYETGPRVPKVEKIQTISTTGDMWRLLEI